MRDDQQPMKVVLPDGARDLVRPDAVHRDIYNNPAVFELEKSRIFERTWVYVAHESEIPNTGDFKSTRVGLEPVIVARRDDASIGVMANRCRHRAATVCQVPSGNVRSFRCMYHGWTFGLDGQLTAAPYPDGYGELDPIDMGLESPWKVESYRGFVFVNRDPESDSLLEHLGAATEYIDSYVEHVPGHAIRVAPDAQRLVYDHNWKMQLENSLDGYHANFVHKSFFSIMQERTKTTTQYVTAKRAADSVGLGNGHAVIDQRHVAAESLLNRLQTLPGAPPPDANLDEFLGIRNGKAVYEATAGPGFNLAIFPNLVLIGVQIREILPLTPSSTEIVLRPLLAEGVPDIVNQFRLRYHELFYGPFGFGQPDDLEIFDRVGAGLTAGTDPWVRLDRGLNRETQKGDERRADITDETPQREQYRMWQRLMEVSS